MPINYFDDLKSNVAYALKEDVGEVDITALLINENEEATAEVICRDEAIICGVPWVDEVFKQVDPNLDVEWLKDDGQVSKPGDLLFRVKGKARSLLTAERPALNYLQSLSATATITSYYASLIAHTKTKLLDTRKTIPGLRMAQKYAVMVGGGMNHRFGLYDAFLIKENHILACGSITQAIKKARDLYSDRRVEVEVETMAELEEAITAKPDWIMLDNFSLTNMTIALNTPHSGILFEASGGIEKESELIKIAETGVDFVSMGILTKNINAIDLSMRFAD
ncbi:MAG: nicotinate-nucleotide pyrophosphorylase (carboxylating) [Candidatus Azotimanducaceae bacterium]|jgi:nicotinate-nucleotide pyrophosphorylase (carboxylating)